jgi:hypothetical protein
LDTKLKAPEIPERQSVLWCSVAARRKICVPRILTHCPTISAMAHVVPRLVNPAMSIPSQMAARTTDG